MTLRAKPQQIANWYAIRTATRQERKVVEGLREMAQEHKLEADVYLPCETRWVRHARVRSTKQVPLFPGYLFVNMAPESLWRAELVFGVYKVLRNLGGDERQAATINPEFLGDLRLAETQGAFDLTATKNPLSYSKGESVRLTGGQFKGWVGQIMECRGKDRVAVLLTIFGRASPIVVKRDQLESQDAEPAEAA